MNTETLTLLIAVAGSVILICFTIIGFFISRVISDVKSNTGNIGENKGRIDLVKQQQQNDIKRIEERTELEIQTMSKKIGELSSSIDLFVKAAIGGNLNIKK